MSYPVFGRSLGTGEMIEASQEKGKRKWTAKDRQRQRDRRARDKKPQGPAKRLYSIPEAACYLGRTVPSLREMIWAGKLQFIRDGRRILLDVHDLDTWIDQCKTRFTY